MNQRKKKINKRKQNDLISKQSEKSQKLIRERNRKANLRKNPAMSIFEAGRERMKRIVKKEFPHTNLSKPPSSIASLSNYALLKSKKKKNKSKNQDTKPIEIKRTTFRLPIREPFAPNFDIYYYLEPNQDPAQISNVFELFEKKKKKLIEKIKLKIKLKTHQKKSSNHPTTTNKDNIEMSTFNSSSTPPPIFNNVNTHSPLKTIHLSSSSCPSNKECNILKESTKDNIIMKDKKKNVNKYNGDNKENIPPFSIMTYPLFGEQIMDMSLNSKVEYENFNISTVSSSSYNERRESFNKTSNNLTNEDLETISINNQIQIDENANEFLNFKLNENQNDNFLLSTTDNKKFVFDKENEHRMKSEQEAFDEENEHRMKSEQEVFDEENEHRMKSEQEVFDEENEQRMKSEQEVFDEENEQLMDEEELETPIQFESINAISDDEMLEFFKIFSNLMPMYEVSDDLQDVIFKNSKNEYRQWYQKVKDCEEETIEWLNARVMFYARRLIEYRKDWIAFWQKIKIENSQYLYYSSSLSNLFGIQLVDEHNKYSNNIFSQMDLSSSDEIYSDNNNYSINTPPPTTSTFVSSSSSSSSCFSSSLLPSSPLISQFPLNNNDMDIVLQEDILNLQTTSDQTNESSMYFDYKEGSIEENSSENNFNPFISSNQTIEMTQVDEETDYLNPLSNDEIGFKIPEAYQKMFENKYLSMLFTLEGCLQDRLDFAEVMFKFKASQFTAESNLS